MRRRATLAASVVAILLTACAPSADPAPARGDASIEGSVAVERRDIESILVVEGVVTPQPLYAVLAPEDGDLDLAVDVGDALVQDALVGRVGKTQVRARYASTVASTDVARGDVRANMPILTAAFHGWAIVIDVAAADLYRLYEGPTAGTANIDGGPSGITCDIAAPATAEEPGRLLCLITDKVILAPGLSARIGLPTAMRRDVLAVAVTAVSGRVGSGVVTRLHADGTSERVSVELGITDGSHIEILSGLQEGDRIAASPPGL